MTQTSRSFLLLQGPKGSFFKKLAAQLRMAGHRTLRINFNGGDRMHFSSRHAMDFLGTLADWPAFVTNIAQQHGITDLMLYGDCRPLHRQAIEALKPLGVRVFVFEEGYFRPDWVTMEENGVNAFSNLPNDAAFYHALPPVADTNEYKRLPLGPSFMRLVGYSIGYYLASALLSARYRHYRTHRPHNYQKEGLAWLWRLTELYMIRKSQQRRKMAALSDPRPYFLVLLQLLGDSQITHHSPYKDMYEFLNEVLRDFAQHAPKDMRIIVKNHPLDNGLTRYKSFLQQKARSLELDDRLIFIDGGHLPTLLASAQGLVTVNSTGGLSAVHHKLPVKTMGTAIYNIDGLVHMGPLADFWHSPKQPDNELYKKFRGYVLKTTQIYGGFYTKRGVRKAVQGTLKRLLCNVPSA